MVGLFLITLFLFTSTMLSFPAQARADENQVTQNTECDGFIHIGPCKVGGTGIDNPRKNPGEIDLTGANLQGKNLTNVNLSGANLSQAKLSGANLTGVDFSGATLTGSNLSAIKLSKQDLIELIKANLAGGG